MSGMVCVKFSAVGVNIDVMASLALEHDEACLQTWRLEMALFLVPFLPLPQGKAHTNDNPLSTHAAAQGC